MSGTIYSTQAKNEEITARMKGANQPISQILELSDQDLKTTITKML